MTSLLSYSITSTTSTPITIYLSTQCNISRQRHYIIQLIFRTYLSCVTQILQGIKCRFAFNSSLRSQILTFYAEWYFCLSIFDTSSFKQSHWFFMNLTSNIRILLIPHPRPHTSPLVPVLHGNLNAQANSCSALCSAAALASLSSHASSPCLFLLPAWCWRLAC